MPDALVEADGVGVRYDSGEVWVGHLDLRVASGEVVLLLGPSGCGKSSLALTLNGLIPHSVAARMRGGVRVAGMDTAQTPPSALCAEVGMVFQDPDAQMLCPTLLDEVCFGLENLLVPTETIEARAMAALKTVGLARTVGEARRRPEELSGGQRQKLALACALAMRPRLLILDEPTANLDPTGARDFYRVLSDVVAQGTGILLIEHDLDDAIALAHRVVVLDATATVRREGPPDEVFADPELLQLGVHEPTAVRIARTLGLGAPARATPLTIEALAVTLGDQAPPPTPVRTAHVSGESMPSPLVEVTNLSVRRGETDALCGISLTVSRGNYLAVTGVNGAGKSTLLACLAGLLRPSSGSVRLDGTDLVRLRGRELSDRIGFVFQNPEHQFLTDSVAEELAHGLRVSARPETEVADRVADVLDRFGLGTYQDVNPFLLSHGEKRRLSVATALIREPELLVLDEPTFGQDRARSDELLALLAELHTAGTTVLIVTHDLQLVAEHTTHVAVLADGELLSLGPTSEVLCDDPLLENAGLRPPPVRRLAKALAPVHAGWKSVYRLSDLEPEPR